MLAKHKVRPEVVPNVVADGSEALNSLKRTSMYDLHCSAEAPALSAFV